MKLKTKTGQLDSRFEISKINLLQEAAEGFDGASAAQKDRGNHYISGFFFCTVLVIIYHN